MKRQLVIIGGAEDKEGDCKILREFVRRAGGLESQIVIMTVATDLYREVGEDYLRVFERLGVEKVSVVDTLHRDEASQERALAAIQAATGIFFTGGDQSRITDILKGTAIDHLLHERLTTGMVIGGTSAGAAMMPEKMIVDGETDTNPRLDTVRLEPGMGFLPDAIVDQHFAQRGRLARLVSAVVQQPKALGLGIDENTAVVIRDHEFEVVGEGAVTIIDMAGVTYSNLSQILKDEDLALYGIQLHILPEGHRFDLNSRQPILDDSDLSPDSLPTRPTEVSAHQMKVTTL